MNPVHSYKNILTKRNSYDLVLELLKLVLAFAVGALGGGKTGLQLENLKKNAQ